MGDTRSSGQSSSSGGGAYLMGAIGAGIYYWQNADDTPADKARAVGKAIVWPAFVVYGLLGHLDGSPAPSDDRES